MEVVICLTLPRGSVVLPIQVYRFRAVVIDDIGLSFNKLCNQTVPGLFSGTVLVDPDINILAPADKQFSTFHAVENIVFTADLFGVHVTWDQVMLRIERVGFVTTIITSEC